MNERTHLDSESEKSNSVSSERKEKEYFASSKASKSREKSKNLGLERQKGWKKAERHIRYIKQRSNKRLEVVVTGRKVGNNGEDNESQKTSCKLFDCR